VNDLIHRIVGIIIEAGQSDTKKFRLGETIRYSPSEILEILKQHESEIFGVDVINLKPCPFCGRKALLRRWTHWDGIYYTIECPECYVDMGEYETIEEVTKAWNRRINDA